MHSLTVRIVVQHPLRRAINLSEVLLHHKYILINSWSVIQNLHICSLWCSLLSKVSITNFLVILYFSFFVFYVLQIVFLFSGLIFTAWKVRCLIDLFALCSLCKALFSRRYFYYPSIIPFWWSFHVCIYDFHLIVIV